MMSGLLLLLAATAVACFNAGLHWYTQVATYPLFANLPPEHFVAYHAAYQRRLPWSIYVPYTLALLTAVALLWLRPDTQSIASVWTVLLLHSAITAISVGLAVPLHTRLDREGLRPPLIRALVRVNALRVVASTLACAVLMAALTQAYRQ
jgi:hypothetical protein